MSRISCGGCDRKMKRKIFFSKNTRADPSLQATSPIYVIVIDYVHLLSASTMHCKATLQTGPEISNSRKIAASRTRGHPPYSPPEALLAQLPAVRKLGIALGEYSSKAPIASAASQLKPGTPAALKCLTASRFKRVHQTTNLCLLHPYSSSSELTPGMIPANGKSSKTLLETEHVPKRDFIFAPFAINVLL